MRWRIQDIETLRETARRNGELSGVRAYYRQLALARQRPNFCSTERELTARHQRRPETQKAGMVGTPSRL